MCQVTEDTLQSLKNAGFEFIGVDFPPEYYIGDSMKLGLSHHLGCA